MKSKHNRDRITLPEKKSAGKKGTGSLQTSGIIQKSIGLVTKYDFIVLFFLFFIAYNTVTAIGIVSGDVVPATFLPVSILVNHNLNFDYISLLANYYPVYAFPLINGHYVSLFPIVTPILITPVYGISYVMCNIFNLPLSSADFLIVAKASASVIAALAGVFF
jgi:hypothetical protein